MRIESSQSLVIAGPVYVSFFSLSFYFVDSRIVHIYGLQCYIYALCKDQSRVPDIFLTLNS